MAKLVITYSDNETMLERVERLAAEWGITPEQLARRAIAEYVGDYGLKELPEGFQPKNLNDLFVATGILRSSEQPPSEPEAGDGP